MDKITIERIKTMHPDLREPLLAQYIECNNLLPKGVRLRFAYTYRSPKEQDKLFNQKPKVTNAKGWQSLHNYGLAFDIVVLKDKNGDGTFETASFDLDEHWMKVVTYFKSKGWEWGGDWKKFKDAPHFQKVFGMPDWRMWKNRINMLMVIKDENGITYPVITSKN
jgi:peptidoglycan L-alanyl-D-glutamate endopeptidase CwlK